jgi:peptidoglycan hydrolase CwlO-like protein
MGKLEEGKYRQKLRDLQLKVEFNEEENRKLKEHSQKLEKEIGKLTEKLQAEKRRVL